MARVTSAEVQYIIDTDIDSDSMDFWINTANTIISEAIDGSTLVSTAQAKKMEQLLVAHFISLNYERQATRRSIGQLSESFANLGKQLEATTYGQSLLLLDPTGKLATRGKKKAFIRAVTSFS
jgi:hypothetical protein